MSDPFADMKTMITRTSTDTLRILGLDPGTTVLGYGLIAAKRGGAEALDYGVIRARGDIPTRLSSIHADVRELIGRHEPDVVAVEDVYFGKNVQTAMRIGEGRAVCVLAAADHDLPVHFYAATKVKKSITGRGNASKKQVQGMVKMVLKLNEIPEPNDAADALAIALCHAHRMGTK